MNLMHRLADEIREAFSERGHGIDKAVQSDRAFRRTRHPQSSMVRGLVLDAIEEAASRIGLGYITLVGGGCDVQDLVDGSDRRFRVLKASQDPETGEYEIVCSSDSVLMITDAEPDSMYRHERWVLAYTVDDAGMIVDIFAAPVLGVTEDSVPRLRLGPITALGSALTPPGPRTGFQPADEDDLDGLSDAADDEDESGQAI